MVEYLVTQLGLALAQEMAQALPSVTALGLVTQTVKGLALGLGARW